MLKNSLFLRGLGIGMFLAAILIFLMNAGSSKLDSFKDNELAHDPGNLSLEQLEEAADRLGYEVKPAGQADDAAGEAGYTRDEVEAEIAKAKSEWEKGRSSDDPTGKYVRSFYISPSMTSNEVANVLLDLDLITDKSAFISIFDERQLHSKIQLGVYVFEDDPEMEDIIARITRS
ncbi:hypothetical protein [Marinicrinis sediminis]|uniref:Endolytic transglycosylase MltG n=1 Tax=Marinicrinis sediminis TaxID=1652465 RepID=A0ABW5R509_9BACL